VQEGSTAQVEPTTPPQPTAPAGSIAHAGPIAPVEESVTDSRLAFAGWLGFTMLLFYALVIGGGWLGMYVGPVRVLNLLIIGIALAAWLVLAALRPAWRPTTAIWPAFVAPLLALGLSITFSQHQRIGLDFLAYAVLLTALYLLLVRIMAMPYARARIGGVLAAITVVMTSAYIVWSVQLWIEWWVLLGEFRVPPLRPGLLGMTWGSPSVVFSVLVLMTTAAVGGIGLRTRGTRITSAVLVLLLVVAGFISGSRSGWLAISGAVVITGALAVLDTRGRELVARAWGQRAFRVALVPAAVVIGLVAVVLGPTVLNRLGQGDAGRLELWATALRMFGDAPVVGFGPGSWMIRRLAYQEAGELNWYQPHAHSQYFQTAAELGLVGLTAGVIAFGAVAWLLYRALRGHESERRRWAWASVFGLTYIGLNVFVDTHTIPSVALLLGLPIAVLDATSRRGLPLPGVPGRVACWLRNLTLVLLALACAAAMQQLIRSESVALTHQEAVAAAGEGDWTAALTPALDAARADPEMGAYGLTAALALVADEDWERAEEAYRSVIEVDQLPDASLGLAYARARQGAPTDEVAAALTEALRLGEQEPALVLAAAEVYDLAGLTEAADAAYVDVLAELPTLAYDEAWRSALGGERFGRIVDQAIAVAPDRGWEVALMAGRIDEAQELAATGPDRAWREAYIAAWEGDPVAYETIQAMTEAQPTNPERLSPAARLADHLEDIESARRYRRLTRLGPHYGPMTISVGYGERRPLADEAVGTGTHYYGTYTYRRAFEVDRLPPGLPGLVLVTNDVREGADDADAE
jgi:O-antigen ligase